MNVDRAQVDLAELLVGRTDDVQELHSARNAAPTDRRCVSERHPTLVERHTRYVMLAKVANKDTQTVVSALIKQAKRLPDELYKSLTWDRGKELADHRRFTLATNIDVDFCDPQSPWQRFQ